VAKSDGLRGYIERLGPWWQRIVALVLTAPACILIAMLWHEEPPALLTVTALLLNGMLWPVTIFLAVSMVMVLAAPWRLAWLGGLLAGGLSVAIGLSCCLAIREPVDYTGVVFTLLTLLSGAVLLVFVAWRQINDAKVPTVAVVLTGILALLPLVQFWHVASFVPSHLSTTLGAAVTMNAVATSNGPHGVVKVKITNSGDVGALILASELIVCFREGPHNLRALDDLYDDDACRTEQIYDDLTEIDARSTWEIQSVIGRDKTPLNRRFVEATVRLWYARQDRLKVGSQIPDLELEDDASVCSSQYRKNDKLTGFKIMDDSRQQGVVQKSRRVVYLSQGDEGDAYFALQVRGDHICSVEHGRPRWSKYPVAESVGEKDLWTTYEGWLSER
jgi:hypothetical protein